MPSWSWLLPRSASPGSKRLGRGAGEQKRLGAGPSIWKEECNPPPPGPLCFHVIVSTLLLAVT